MPKINANSIRTGNILEHEGRLYAVMKREHTKPGKGGAFIQVEMKDIKTGTKLNHRFRSSEDVERARLDQRDCQYLFASEHAITLMDLESYEQFDVSIDLVGDAMIFLQDGMQVILESYEEEPVSIELPETVVLEVSDTEGVVKGQTAASSYKPATLENGLRTMVPPFIETGEKVVVRTADATYLERAK